MKTYTIPQRMTGTGSNRDLASDQFDRHIAFAPGCKFAVVLAAHYGGKGYTTHRTEKAAIAASRRSSEFSHRIIDSEGAAYVVDGGRLKKIDLANHVRPIGTMTVQTGELREQAAKALSA